MDFSRLETINRDPSTNPRDLTRVQVGVVPAKDLLPVPGRCGEHELFSTSPTGRYSPEEWAEFVADIRKRGIQDQVLVCVEADGTIAVWEGNHRIRAAAEAGVPVPVEVRHFGAAGERVPNNTFTLFPRNGAERECACQNIREAGAWTRELRCLLFSLWIPAEDGFSFTWTDLPNGGAVLRDCRGVVHYQGSQSKFSWWQASIQALGCVLTRLPVAA